MSETIQIYYSFNVIKQMLENNTLSWDNKKIKNIQDLFSNVNDQFQGFIEFNQEDFKFFKVDDEKKFSMLTVKKMEELLEKNNIKNFNLFLNDYQILYKKLNTHVKKNKDLDYILNNIKKTEEKSEEHKKHIIVTDFIEESELIKFYQLLNDDGIFCDI